MNVHTRSVGGSLTYYTGIRVDAPKVIHNSLDHVGEELKYEVEVEEWREKKMQRKGGVGEWREVFFFSMPHRTVRTSRVARHT